jgi:diguanylate cyclase (GGDEF)-like protein
MKWGSPGTLLAMTDIVADSHAARADPICNPLHGALAESRQRWRDLVSIAADLVFETDALGRIAFVTPDPALGWSASELLGKPGESLLAGGEGLVGFNPFRPASPIRGRRAWIRRGDGSVACLVFASAPLLDAGAKFVGVRGLGMDVTDQDRRDGSAATALRRAAVIDGILWRMRQEVLAPRMMRAVLEELANAVGAEGAAVIAEGPTVLHQTGAGAGCVLEAVAALLKRIDETSPVLADQVNGIRILVSACQTRFGETVGLALWRLPGPRGWDVDDRVLVGSASGIIRVVLEHHSIQREMARRARTDSLTGLMNRRAFLQELPRHIDRLEREQLPGTLVFADLDNFKAVNDELGHEMGDQVLCRAAELLRGTVRPTDLVARLGGDEFAVWMNGADHLTAAERAEALRVQAPGALAEVIDRESPALGFSIGIATRHAGEEVESVMQRADMAMYQVKRDGRGNWRVSQG